MKNKQKRFICIVSFTVHIEKTVCQHKASLFLMDDDVNDDLEGDVR